MIKITRDDIQDINEAVLIEKLENLGTPLGQYWEVHIGINTGCKPAFEIDEFTRQQWINQDSRNAEIIKLGVGKPEKKRWKSDLKHLIWIASSEFKQWPWSNAENESTAEIIFEEVYPTISQHLKEYRDKLKNRSADYQGKFYWELPKPEKCPEFNDNKIIFYFYHSMVACYDTSGAFVINRYVHSIPTNQLFLLAILNNKLFEWYAITKWHLKGEKWYIGKRNMKNFPIAGTKTQKAELSNLVQRILDDPDSPDVAVFEKEINQLVYELYELTPAEIKLIEEESNK